MADKIELGKVNEKYTGYIYRTVNKVNQKWYIGSCWCKNIDRIGYLGSGILLSKAIKKYGRDKFEQTVLFYYFEQDPFGLKDIESEILKEIDAAENPQSYNLKNYGYGLPWGENKNAPPEVIKLWSENNFWRNNPLAPEHFERLQLGRLEFQTSEKGKAFAKRNAIHLENFRNSPAWKDLVAKFQKFAQSPRTQQHKANISRALNGKEKTAEHRKNLSEALKASDKNIGANNPRARECIRLDTMETFGSVGDLVDNLNTDTALQITATVSGAWYAINKSDYGGFYKEKVYLAFTKARRSKSFSLMNASRTTRRAQILKLLKAGKSQKKIYEETGASHKLIRSVINGENFNYLPKRGKLTLRKGALILKKYHEGKNDGEIASEIPGVTKRMVNLVRQKNSLPAYEKLSPYKIGQIQKAIENNQKTETIMKKLKVAHRTVAKIRKSLDCK